METGIFILVIMAISVSYIIPIVCIAILAKQVIKLHRLLRETTREYKMYTASVNKDYKTVGVLRNSFAGGKEEPEEEPEEKKPTPPGATLIQHG